MIINQRVDHLECILRAYCFVTLMFAVVLTCVPVNETFHNSFDKLICRNIFRSIRSHHTHTRSDTSSIFSNILPTLINISSRAFSTNDSIPFIYCEWTIAITFLRSTTANSYKKYPIRIKANQTGCAKSAKLNFIC